MHLQAFLPWGARTEGKTDGVEHALLSPPSLSGFAPGSGEREGPREGLLSGVAQEGGVDGVGVGRGKEVEMAVWVGDRVVGCMGRLLFFGAHMQMNTLGLSLCSCSALAYTGISS